MKLSKLIRELQSKLDSFGDMEVHVPPGNDRRVVPIDTAWISGGDKWSLTLTGSERGEDGNTDD